MGVYVALAMGHCLAIILTLVGAASSSRRLVPCCLRRRQRPSPPCPGANDPGTWRRCKVADLVVTAFMRAFGRNGVFGVDHPHFDRLLTLRELLDISWQSYQAYLMSTLLSRAPLIRFYVGLLMCNCVFGTVLRHLLPAHARWRRVWRILADVMLDVLTIVGVPGVLMAGYYADYDPALKDFAFELWASDVWAVRAASELQLILIVSWLDLLCKTWVSIGILLSLGNVADIVHGGLGPGVGINNKPKGKYPGNLTSIAVAPYVSAAAESTPAPPSSPRRARIFRRVDAHGLFLVWGLAILGIHLHATSRGSLASCPVQLRPWFITRPTCAVVIVDCPRLGMLGTEAEFDRGGWVGVQRDFVTRLVIRHCPELDVPRGLLEFRRLRLLKVYNSTIRTWTGAATLDGARHPVLQALNLVRIAFPDGHLPPGLLGPAFPGTLVDIEICTSNLRALPGDLDEIWPHGAILTFEQCAFDEVPAVIGRLEPYLLSFAENRLTRFPAWLVTLPGLQILSLAGNSLDALPPTSEVLVERIESLMLLHFDGTGVDALPAWVDVLLERNADLGFDVLYASNSPLCGFVLDAISPVTTWASSSSTSSSSASPWTSANDLSVRMASREALADAIYCVDEPNHFYLLDMEDAQHGWGAVRAEGGGVVNASGG